MSVSGWTEVMRVLNSSEKLLEATLRGDEKSVAEGLDKAHTEVASILTYNDENSLACAISLVHHCINLEVIVLDIRVSCASTNRRCSGLHLGSQACRWHG